MPDTNNSTMFRNLRNRLLFSQLMVMAAILAVFGTGVYGFFIRSLHRQLDKKLLTLAQSATPVLAEIESTGDEYLDGVNEVPWRDIFNRDRQSLEWFDADGRLLAHRGMIELTSSPKIGAHMLLTTSAEQIQVRAYTVSVFQDSPGVAQPILEGYVRASQSVQDIETVQAQLIWGLGMGGAIALVGVGVGGLWLTRRSLEPVETSFEQLKQFTADASHELRSPLTAIKTSVDVIRNHPERIHPKDARKLTAIASATNQMSQLADDLLFLARADVPGIAKIQQKPILLPEVLHDVVELLDPSAQAKSIALTCQCRVTAITLGDRAQLYRLFSNLVHNAIQYTPEGGKVTVTLSQVNSRTALIQVEDTGIGIAKDQLRFIFDRFWRADRARSRRHGGTGLGLAIAQAIAQRHGGKINVHSQLGNGSCFQVRLPINSGIQPKPKEILE